MPKRLAFGTLEAGNPPAVTKIDGKRYEAQVRNVTKSYANQVAKKWRKQGWSARILPTDFGRYGYSVYIRKK